jgi:hypothetical protein
LAPVLLYFLSDELIKPVLELWHKKISSTGCDQMKKNTSTDSYPGNKADLLDKLIQHGNTDEMGLLDLIFIEEILKQKNQGKAI